VSRSKNETATTTDSESRNSGKRQTRWATARKRLAMPTGTVKSREEEWRAIQTRLGEILSRHGRNAPQGDYYLVDKDLGTYDQKVLVFFEDILRPELVEAVEDSLWEYSLEWRVLFVLANKDGTEMIPPMGLKVSVYGPEPLQRPVMSPEERSETRALYDTLEQLLSTHGRSDPFGNGDYWIVDDRWSPRSHKVCIFNIEFLTPQLVEEVQRLLKQNFPTCVVWFQIEVVEPGVPIPLPGICVFADRVEQDWDRDKMRSLFKDRFVW
jgi:hypothetical protein